MGARRKPVGKRTGEGESSPSPQERWARALDVWCQETGELNQRMRDFLLKSDPVCSTCGESQMRLATSILYGVDVRVCQHCGRTINPHLSNP